MDQLTPYVNTLSRAGTRYARYSPRLRTAAIAGRTARFAYDNRREAAHAARVIQRAAKRAAKYAYARNKPRAADKVGEPVGSGNTKRGLTVFEGPTLKPTRTLHFNNILDIARGIQVDERTRDIINVRGFKLCMEIKSLTASVSPGDQLLFNVAVISPRDSTSTSVTDFFRNNSGDSRGTDFSTGLTSTEFHCLPINSDKYHVLMHKKVVLGDSLNDVNPSHVFIDEYIKIDRQFRFDSGTTSTANNSIYLVYWADISMKAAGSLVEINAFNMSNTGILYFRETCTC